MEKMTIVKAMEYAIDTFGTEAPAEVVEKWVSIRDAQLKKSLNRKPTKAQEENAEIKAVILEALTAEGATVTEIQSKDEALANLSNQKVAALLRQLVADGKAIKIVDKKKSLFALPAEAEVEAE